MIALKATIKRQVHLDYLKIGGNIIISASYQATLQEFATKGISREDGEALLRKSVEIAREIRDIYYDRASKGSWDVIGDPKALNVDSLLLFLLEANAYLADGSKYRNFSSQGLVTFSCIVVAYMGMQ